MSRCKYIQPVYTQLKFGVDLKELFSPWYLHPAIKNLIYLAETNVKCRNGSRFDVEELLSKGSHGEGTIRQRLELKERLITGKNIIDIDIAPGVPLWVLRHFLGHLPTPIFPPKYDEHYWYNFCIRHYDQLVESVKRRNACNDLKETIAFELAHLPARSITFLFEFFELIRYLSLRSIDEDVVDKHAALLFVRYYTPSMFARPYRPGNLVKNDKKYFAFILFCIHFWPDLRVKIHNIFVKSMNTNPEKFYYYPEIYDRYPETNLFVKDMGIQTDFDFESDFMLSIDSSSEESSDTRRNKIKTDKKFHDKFQLLDLNLNDTEFNPVDSDDDSNHRIFSSTPRDITIIKSAENSKIKLENINNEKFSKTSCTGVTQTTASNIKNRLPLLEKVSSENIDQYYNTINKNDCKFLKTVCTQTNLVSPREDAVPVSSKITVKTHKRNRKLEKSKNKNYVILEIPSTSKINSKNVKVMSYQSTQKLLKGQEPKSVKSESKLSSKNKMKSLEVQTFEHNSPNNSNTSNGDFIYDSFLGNCYEENESTLQPQKLFSTYSLSPQATPSVDLYKRITKYGWTYNNSQSNTQVPPEQLSEQMDIYKLSVDDQKSLNDSYKTADNDQKSHRSLKSLNSETPLTDEIKKKRSITSSFKKIGSKFMFLKKRSDTNKAISCTDFSNVKYKKITKSVKSI